MDNLSELQRKKCMSLIRCKDTKAEVLFRDLLHRNGIRGYRKNYKKVKGRPDLYFGKVKLAVFIDGCFWHKCPKCFTRSKTRRSYWDKKVRYNVKRDNVVKEDLLEQGVVVLRFWEHSILNDIDKCYRDFLNVYEKKIQDN